MMRGGVRRGLATHKRESHNPKSSTAAQNALHDGQTVILAVRDPVPSTKPASLTVPAADGTAPATSSSSSPPAASAATNGLESPVTETEAMLTAKNYRLAKELSDIRVRHREEHKNVTRLTMENMSLASRCREAITQASNMKRDLSMQKRKTAEAVAQTHLLLEQLKRFKQQQVLQEQQLQLQQLPRQEMAAVHTEKDVKSDEEVCVIVPTLVETPGTPPVVFEEKLLVAALEEDNKQTNDEDDIKESLEKIPSVPLEPDATDASIPEVSSNAHEIDRLPFLNEDVPSELSELPISSGDDRSNVKHEFVSAATTEMDDSEHKEDDGTAVVSALHSISLEGVVFNSYNPIATSALVSSDDFENSGMNDDDENADSMADGTNEILPSQSHQQAVPDDGLRVSTSNVADLSSEISSKLPVVDQRTTISNSSTFKPRKTVVSDLSSFNSAKESKDSWLEDYDEAAETSDTLMNLMDSRSIQKGFFPHSASPKVARRYNHTSLNESYDEEFPSDIIQQPILNSGRKSQSSRRDANTEPETLPSSLPPMRAQESSGSTLLSSIDAFEASFITGFPDSFSPKDSAVSTSPSGAEKIPETSIYDPFVASSSIPSSQDGALVNVATLDAEIKKSTTGWGSGIRDRAVAAFQRNPRREQAADAPGSDHTASFQELAESRHLPNKKNENPIENTTTATPAEAAKASTPVDRDAISARWLNEVKLSTDREVGYKSSASPQLNVVSRMRGGDEVTSSVLGFKKLTSDVKRASAENNLSPVVDRTVKMVTATVSPSTRLSPVTYPMVNTSNVEGNSPLLRQRSAVPPSSRSPRQNVPSALTSETYDASRYSTPISDTVPTSTLLHSPEIAPSEGFDSVRARYEKAAAPRSSNNASDVTLETGRSSTTGIFRTLPSHASHAEDNLDQASPSVNVRERAAIFSSSQHSHSGGSRGKSSWRTAGGSDDSGDIPMRTSLSPRKLRSDEYTMAPAIVLSVSPVKSEYSSDDLKPVALRSWRQRERSRDAADQDGDRGRVRAVVFSDTEQSPQHHDLGRQRRHINLSGATRQIRQADRGNGASPLRGSNREI